MPKSPEEWLAEVDTAQRPAVFKLFLGYAPGVGKTYAMLSEGVRRASRGEEVVIGVVETHGRKPIVELSSRLEAVPRKKLEYKSTIFEEMDVTRFWRASRMLCWWMNWPTPTLKAASTRNAMRMSSSCWMRVSTFFPR